MLHQLGGGSGLCPAAWFLCFLLLEPQELRPEQFALEPLQGQLPWPASVQKDVASAEELSFQSTIMILLLSFSQSHPRSLQPFGLPEADTHVLAAGCLSAAPEKKGD